MIQDMVREDVGMVVMICCMSLHFGSKKCKTWVLNLTRRQFCCQVELKICFDAVGCLHVCQFPSSLTI